jgi:hypothetical protein
MGLLLRPDRPLRRRADARLRSGPLARPGCWPRSPGAAQFPFGIAQGR